MILRNDTTHKSDKFAAVLNTELGDIDQTHLIVQLIHMLVALVEIDNIAGDLLDLTVYFIQQLLGLTLTLFAYN